MVIFYRRLPKFEYIKPESQNMLFEILSDNKNCSVYAGGTDLIPKLKKRLIKPPDVLIDLKGLNELDYIKIEGGALKIGALSTIYSVATSKIVIEKFNILSQAAKSIAAFQIQNRGTIVGNICNAVPSADSAPALLVLNAKLNIKKKDGSRKVNIDEFFIGPNKTVLDKDEIVTEVEISEVPSSFKGIYYKLSTRGKMDLATVGVAVLLGSDNGRFSDIRIGLGAVAPTPIRAKRAEELLKGEKINKELINNAARIASDESSPIDDHRASATYRKIMVETLVKRAICRLTEVG
ncbi:MAG TPA: FAD binding domain-containing protein [Syntrophorhabdaceae bacterium]|nr:FAD binding domain-containing protein [Syntrophorhabdaceae bacterium]